MSVAMFYLSARTDEERSFYVPVLTADVFNEVLLPVANRLSLSLVPYLETGVEVSADNFDLLAEELAQISAELSGPARDLVIGRLSRVSAELRKIFRQNPEARVYIG